MYVSYCKNCNHFFYLSRICNYCKECKAPLMRLSIPFDEFSKLSLNERYKLAYKLTNKM